MVHRHLDGPVRKLLVMYGALPLAYVIAGRLGLLLAILPGYATAVFLPAGIAVAAAFIAGMDSLPGTFLGSFLLNLWIGYSFNHELDVTKIVAAAAIAVASAVQAAIGGIALRRAIRYPALLDNPRDLLLFLLLSPLVCLTSATISVGMMWMLGVIRPADVTVNWMTWWVGDTLGVLVVLPLMLVLAGQPHPLWQLRKRYVAIPMSLCFALFVAIFVRVKNSEEAQSLTEFQLRSQELADSIKAELAEQKLFLEQLSSAFINRRAAVDRSDFRGLVRVLLQRFPNTQAVEWAPRIVASERQSFESAQRRDEPAYEIREGDPSRGMRSAGDRPEFYPVTYIEPLAGNEVAAGFDLASDPSRQEAIAASISSGKVIATAPVQLVQEPSEHAGVLLIRAVSSGPTGPGIVLVALRAGSFASTLLAPVQSTLGLRFIDITSRQSLFDNPPAMEPAYQTTLDFGTRRYLIQTAPSANYLEEHRGWQSWVVLMSGLFSTGLLGAFLMLGTGHAYRLRVNEQELEAVIDRTPFMLTRCSRDLRYRFVSESYGKMICRRPQDVAGKPIVEIIGEEGFETIRPHIDTVLQGERTEYEREVHFHGVGKRVLHVVYTPDRTERGAVEGWIASMIDVTERKRAELQRDLLIAEVNHRVKNTLATVISIAHQSFKTEQPLDASIQSFDERIRALAHTHTRLAETNWSGVALRMLVADETAPYRTTGNVRFEGPDIKLSPKCAISLGMALHELATNAAKYGALSTIEGSVDINWEFCPSQNEVRLTWAEFGGPKVAPPRRSGFGRMLLEKALASDLSGTVTQDFREKGLSCLITFPIDRHALAATEHEVSKVSHLENDTVYAPKDRLERTADSHRLTGVRVLLVEDESVLAIQLEQVLNSLGSSVIGPFNNLTQALQAAQRETIDVAILDTNLNGEMVYPLAEELLARGVLVLFLTGYDASDLPERFRVIPRVAKPFAEIEIIKQIEAIMIAAPASGETDS
jgi:PAS domain S-box-containing protein